MIEYATCHPDRKIRAKGLCEYCYSKQYRQSRPEANSRYTQKYRSKLPPIVYRWRDGDGNVDYVGYGYKLRMTAHKTRSKWWTSEHTYSYMVCRNEWHAMHMEGLWGELFQPRYNKIGYRR